MYYGCCGDEIRMTLTIHTDNIERYRPETTHTFNGIDYEILGWSYTWVHPNYATVDLRMFKKERPKTPEQILAAERYAHCKAKMEAAKKDMEYWEGKL